MDIDKIFKYKNQLEKDLTFAEICKLFREIAYSKVAYWSEDDKGQVYDGSYSQVNVEQASRMQQRISTVVDLYNQVITNHREFDEGYLQSKGI